MTEIQQGLFGVVIFDSGTGWDRGTNRRGWWGCREKRGNGSMPRWQGTSSMNQELRQDRSGSQEKG